MASPGRDVTEWLQKALHDQRAAEVALAATPSITDVAAFHCQQAVEKLLKAYLVSRAHEFEKIHDLRLLSAECAAIDPDFLQLSTVVGPLTSYAVRYRYPGPSDPTVEEVREALDVVRTTWDFVVSRLPPETRLPA